MNQTIRLTLDGVTHDIDIYSAKIAEASECERLTGWTWPEWRDELGRSHSVAVAFLWWAAAKRAGTPLEGKFTDLNFDLNDLVVEFLDDDDDVDDAEDTAEAGPTSPVEESVDEPPSTTSPLVTDPLSSTTSG